MGVSASFTKIQVLIQTLANKNLIFKTNVICLQDWYFYDQALVDYIYWEWLLISFLIKVHIWFYTVGLLDSLLMSWLNILCYWMWWFGDHTWRLGDHIRSSTDDILTYNPMWLFSKKYTCTSKSTLNIRWWYTLVLKTSGQKDFFSLHSSLVWAYLGLMLLFSIYTDALAWFLIFIFYF